ncbi:MAG: hypothetical protein ACLQBJ_20270 [Bryobacteraceae bacterium]
MILTTPNELSVCRLAGLSGLPADETWARAEAVRDGRRVTLWSRPDLAPESLLDVPPAELPEGRAIRVDTRDGALEWDLSWPLPLDVHWLREITAGFPLGVRPVRVDAGARATASIRLSGEFQSVVWLEAGGRTRLSIHRLAGARAEAGCAIQTDCRVAPQGFDGLLRALTGTTSVDWLRGVFADSCSLRWRDLAERVGARTDHLDDLALFFRGLTTSEEHALWAAATSTQSLASLGEWAAALDQNAPPEAFAELLRQELELQGQAFRDSAAGRWLMAVSGASLAGLTEARTAQGLAAAAAHVSSLLKRAELVGLLVRLRREAEAEWSALAAWYRDRIAASCGELSAGSSAANIEASVNLWMKRLRDRLCREAAEAARRRVAAELAASLDGLAGETPLADLAFPAGRRCGAALESALEGDLRPGLETGGGLLIGGSALSACQESDRVEIVLPFLNKRAWHMERERLAEAPIRHSAGRLSVVMPTDPPEPAASRETAALLLGGVFTARAEAPANDLIHLCYEDRRVVLRDEPNSPWLRLLGAYGLRAPALPPQPCQATLSLQAPWRWVEAWSQMPLKREADYVDRFMRLSLALQEMGRYWLPALWLADAGCYEAPSVAWPVLVYAASQPFVDRKRGQYGYDPMIPNSVQRAAATALNHLPELLAPIHSDLRAAGRASAAEHYAPRRSRQIVAAVQRHPRVFTNLLAGDSFFLEHCFHIANLARELRPLARRNPSQGLRKLAQFTEEIVKAFQRGLKRLHTDPSCRDLGALYLLEATRVLAGDPAQRGLWVSLTLETAGGVQRLQIAA